MGNINKHKFLIMDIKDRELLFVRSFERFYLVRNLIKKLNLVNVFFLELDNLIYTDTDYLLNMFITNNVPMSLMWSNSEHISTGICFIKILNSINKMIKHYMTHSIRAPNYCLSRNESSYDYL